MYFNTNHPPLGPEWVYVWQNFRVMLMISPLKCIGFNSKIYKIIMRFQCIITVRSLITYTHESIQIQFCTIRKRVIFLFWCINEITSHWKFTLIKCGGTEVQTPNLIFNLVISVFPSVDIWFDDNEGKTLEIHIGVLIFSKLWKQVDIIIINLYYMLFIIDVTQS
jgi:hypothetical protein